MHKNIQFLTAAGVGLLSGILFVGTISLTIPRAYGQVEGDRALDCSAALAIVAVAFRDNEPDKLPPVLEDLEVWGQRLGKARYKEIWPHYQKREAEYGPEWGIQTALSCRKELLDGKCLQTVTKAQDQALWYMKAARTQAAVAVGVGASLTPVADDIREGCKHLSIARNNVRALRCDQQVIDAADRIWHDYVLILPGPKGDLRYACQGND